MRQTAVKNDKAEEEFKLAPQNEELNAVSISNSRCLGLLASEDCDFLLSPNQTQAKISDIEDKVIGIYFSANWHPACQSFSQILVDVYGQIQSRGFGFEVVFVSSDEDLDAFNKYRAHMRWLAIPFSDLDTKKALNQRFEIEDIPCLIILQTNDEKDEDILRNGVELIYRYGAQPFPFTKERLGELPREEEEKHESQTSVNLLTNPDRDFLLAHSIPKQLPMTSLTGKTIGLFFSAQWCIPGVKFTPRLVTTYKKKREKLKEKGGQEDFEIVFVSSDRDRIPFESSFETMPWLALPFGDPAIKNLTKHFDIQGIPSLVILGPDGKTVTKLGRNVINLYKENAYPFTEARVELLERQMDEEAKSLSRIVSHAGHRHELTLVSEGTKGGPFICCDCDEQGSGWACQCIECGYEVHTKCVRPVDQGPNIGR